jgi:hypothetical protein
VVVDLRGLEFLDPVGARALAGLCGGVRRSGRRLTVVPSSPAVQAVLELTAGEARGNVAASHDVPSPHGGARLPWTGLKAINDREGHAAGDALIVGVAEAIRANLRPYDPRRPGRR